MAEQPETTAQAGQGEKTFKLQRVFLKDLSFEAPGAPDIFLKEWKPELSVQISNHARRIQPEKDEYEVTVGVTVTARSGESVVYLVEVKQAGIFSIEGIEGAELEGLLGAYCPSILYPYAREVITSTVDRGSFPQLLLQPINFDQLYQQSRQYAQSEQGATQPGADTQH